MIFAVKYNGRFPVNSIVFDFLMFPNKIWPVFIVVRGRTFTGCAVWPSSLLFAAKPTTDIRTVRLGGSGDSCPGRGRRGTREYLSDVSDPTGRPV